MPATHCAERSATWLLPRRQRGDKVSEYLGNTPAVCRASCIDPRVIELVAEGRTVAAARSRLGDGAVLGGPATQGAVEKDLTGASRELKGEVVKRKASGVPWDHVDEVRNAQGGLLNQIAAINRKLAHPGTSAAMRDLLVAYLGRASRMLDFSEQFVPRIK